MTLVCGQSLNLQSQIVSRKVDLLAPRGRPTAPTHHPPPPGYGPGSYNTRDVGKMMVAFNTCHHKCADVLLDSGTDTPSAHLSAIPVSVLYC